MSKNVPLIFGVVFFLLAAGGITYVVKTAGPDTGDPVLIQLTAGNPSLEVSQRLNDSGNRVPTFWVKDKSSGREALMPRSLADDGKATIAFVPCDSAPIPPRLLPPKIVTPPVCVQITGDGEVLNAFFFTTKGQVGDMIKYYDGPPSPGENRRPNFWWEEESMRQDLKTMAFAYSYYLHGGGSGTDFKVDALVGYKRERTPSI
jgi:hypothetical protein